MVWKLKEVGYEGLKEASSEVAENEFLLAETCSEDFVDSQDYVNFLQDKLQGIKLKLMKWMMNQWVFTIHDLNYDLSIPLQMTMYIFRGHQKKILGLQY